MSLATDSWPGEDPAEVAAAARISILAAASRTLPVHGLTRQQQRLVELIEMCTDPSHVDGSDFPEFLERAQDAVGASAASLIRSAGSLNATLADIASGVASDILGHTYDALAQLVVDLYRPSLGNLTIPTLERTVMSASQPEGVSVAGSGGGGGDSVELIIYAPSLNLFGLALAPYILAHELVCHAFSRHTGHWSTVPDPDIRAYFADGFMDRAAWHLVLTWLEDDAIPTATPVGHLSEAEASYAVARPHFFRAGRAAWTNCRKAVRERLTDVPEPAIRSGEVDSALIRAAISLNACDQNVTHKDRFVSHARQGDAVATQGLARIAVDGSEPAQLFEDLNGI